MSIEFGINRVDGDRVTIPDMHGRNVELTHTNARLKVYGQGEGQYDHGMFTGLDGNTNLFMPDKELLSVLAERDYPIDYLETLDKLGLQFFAAYQRAKLESSRENH